MQKREEDEQKKVNREEDEQEKVKMEEDEQENVKVKVNKINSWPFDFRLNGQD